MSIPFVPDLTLGYDLIYAYTGTISSNTTTTGDAVDTQDYEGPIHMLVTTGDVGDASTVVTFKLTESTTSSGSYTDISGVTQTLTASATANDKKGYILRADTYQKRYVQSAVITSGGTASVPITISILARRKIGGGAGVITTGYSN